jgi:hypothetical protein
MNPENSQPETEKQQNEKLLRLMTGYGQHASLLLNSKSYKIVERKRAR